MKGYELYDGSMSSDYKIGDEFIVVGDTFNYESGSLVSLYKDDGSSNPLFKTLKGSCRFNIADGKSGAFADWSSLIPTKETKEKVKSRKNIVTVKLKLENNFTPNYNHWHKIEIPFTKIDLKDGMRCITREGVTWYVCGDILGINSLRITLYHFNSNLKHVYSDKHDIMKVIDRDGTVMFERKESITKAEAEKRLGVEIEG